MGGGVSSLPLQMNKATFRELCGGILNDDVFDQYAHNGMLSRDKLIELSAQRDAMMSHDWGYDDTGRDIGEVVARVVANLRGRGLVLYFDNARELSDGRQGRNNNDLIGRVTEGVNQSKCIVCFLTKEYIQKVYGPDSVEKCNIEFNYTLKRKHPNLMIPVILENALLPNNSAKQRDTMLWVGNVDLALGDSPFIDMTMNATRSDFDLRCEELYHKIIKISRANNDERDKNIKNKLSNAGADSILSQVNKSKEEQQFFQWMARATNIDESRRLVYCTSLVKAGVSTVFVLANMMKTVPGFLVGLGMNEYDADQIAIAIRDLGLGYMPVREFDSSVTLESVQFALSKSNMARDDPEMAESALACVARVAGSSRIMPSLLSDAGIADAVLKLMRLHLAHAGCNKFANLALHLIADNNPEVSWKLGDLGVADALPRSIRIHVDDCEVSALGCQAIATLARVHKRNREKFCISGACEMVIRTLQKHSYDSFAVTMSCQAAVNLSLNHMENVGKLLQAGCALASATALEAHYTDPHAVQQVLNIMDIVARDPNCRQVFGTETPCCSALVKSLDALMDHPAVLYHGCLAMSTIMNGNTFNRTEIGKFGGCEVACRILERYSQNDPDVSLAACKAIFGLCAGNPHHKEKVLQMQAPFYMQGILSNPVMPEETRKEAIEALRYLVPSQPHYGFS